MAINPNFSQQDVANRFEKFLEVVERRGTERMKRIGEMCIEHAREIPASIGFHDQTGNLRSSIGYAVFVNGISVHESYPQILGGTEGISKGKALASHVGAKYTQGVSLVVTAGMNYAVWVEARGKVVLTSTETLARQVVPEMMEQLITNIQKAIDS